MELSPACAEMRLALSARRDGVAYERERLDAHLARCLDCAALEHELEHLAPQWNALERPEPPDDLWARIEASLEPAPRRWSAAARVLLRTAAALLGFLGAHAAARTLEAPVDARAHLLGRWFAPTPELDIRTRLAAAPELQLLRSRRSNLEEDR